MHTNTLRAALLAYKFPPESKGWALIFGRVLCGYLAEHRDWFEKFDYIIPSPTFTGPGSRRTWDHIRLILERAAVEADEPWPFFLSQPPLIMKTRDTTSMTGKTLRERRTIAETELRPALSVPRPELVQGKRVLVFDDVFTDGSTLQEIALRLRAAGAVDVAQVVLARAPWRQ